MAAEEVFGGRGGEETTAATVTPAASESGSAPGSPRNKVKLLCSHGGKILPRPADGHLKYVGGETRIVSFPRDINFSELMKKLATVSGGDIVLKYQLIPEDLDALVSVKNDVDLRHMLDEHDRYESAGNPMLRAFLFPANPVVIENRITSMEQPLAVDQRYIDAINGIIRATMTAAGTAAKHPVFTRKSLSPSGLSSASSSPKSPESLNIDSVNLETAPPNGFQKSLLNMHRVHSSPSVYSLGSQKHGSGTTTPVNHQHHQIYQPFHHHGQLSPRKQTPEKLVSVRSVGRDESWRYQVVPAATPSNYCPVAVSRHIRGRGCYCSKCMHFDEHGGYVNRNLGRAGSPFRSPPLPESPS